MNRIIALLAVAIALTLPATGSRAAELVMFERPGCVWCARFNAEIAPIYAKTEESQAAPLRRVDLNSPLPADLAGIDPGVFTPTFVVVKEGREIGRIRGYPGDAFFFGLLDRILSNTVPEPAKS
ncbi:thioredoxin [Bradyrhizobium liaoningense]|uniref:thioredoxin n=1 Tax=Bradyrhizobium liaoningense TaxID=43992 RepID=UPI001BAA23E7|nr:thioredoxin [Bradyrhizobium liaoningense]MBR0839926.1 thioredoxin [Bradyrhizobium liaoningense]MBR0854067.1 thioredoxin [Bradyrhizobium liaoningense]